MCGAWAAGVGWRVSVCWGVKNWSCTEVTTIRIGVRYMGVIRVRIIV